MILLSEVFGPTIQGEGAGIGEPTVFVRTAGCDFRCAWCDTLHAVDKSHRGDWYERSADAVLAEIEQLSGGQPLLVTISGGNPATQDLTRLIQLGQEKGYRFAVETQGSVAAPWFGLLDMMTLSPKPPSSKMRFSRDRFENSLLRAGDKPDVSLKIVIADEDDLDWAGELKARYPQLPLFLQVCNTQLNGDPDQSKIAADMRWLVDQVMARQWYDVKVLPQLHVYLWGNALGV
uniref:7-carboxy-7-deazaguanine synthase QueE n=1 Tax=Thaumasiovibrio occultus TaxID=1891184 RepID=UPI000B35E296|nr:7-carboxy-7-deazaguanine synthase QueE [Thaumasiovibrio occultus]